MATGAVTDLGASETSVCGEAPSSHTMPIAGTAAVRVLGAILWVAKRCTIAALILLVLAPHLAILLALWTTGAVAGILTGWSRKRPCPILSVRTPLNQLPVW